MELISKLNAIMLSLSTIQWEMVKVISFYVKVIGEARGVSLVVNMIFLLVKPLVSVFHSCSNCQESQREPSVEVCLCKATFVHNRFCATEADLQGQRLWCVQLERKLNEM